MRSALLTLAALAMSAGLASASITYSSPCAVVMIANTSGNTGSICSVTPDGGFYINSLTLTITDDYTGFESGNPVVSYGATLTQSTAVFGAVFCNVITGGSASTPCAVQITPASTISGLDLAGFTIQLTSAFNTVAGGAVAGASEVMTISATELPVSTPEPATFSIMGAALVGLGFVARRRKI